MRFFNILAALLLVGVIALAPARAGAQEVTLIRDSEIEGIIRAYATPVFQAAGLSPHAVDIYLIQDRSLNAFVIAGNRMFLHTGLLLRADDPLEVIGVIAHEAGHIAGGHIVARGDEVRSAMLKALAATLLGVGAAVATGDGRAGAAAVSIGQDVALRGLLSYTQSQENAADQAAVTYLRRAGLSPRGLRDFMAVLEDQEVLMSSSQDPYLRTHPLTRDRIRFLDQAVRESPYADEPAPPELKALHDRMQAKLIGFLEPRRTVLQRYPEGDQTLPARYARAISDFRTGRIDDGLRELDRLLEDHPQDPHFNELRGQMLLESGRPAEALPSYRRAVELRPEEPLIRLRLAQTLIELDGDEEDREALRHLDRVLAREDDNASAWRLVAIAHGRLGDTGQAALALAEMNYARGDYRDAQGQAVRAKHLLPQGTPAWRRAEDLALVAEREAERVERQERR